MLRSRAEGRGSDMDDMAKLRSLHNSGCTVSTDMPEEQSQQGLLQVFQITNVHQPRLAFIEGQ